MTKPVIRLGRRYRQDLGDLSGLAASIRARGLIQPIVIAPDGTLLAGRRRLEAWRLAFGLDAQPPVRVVEGLDAVAAEFDENVHRLALKPSEQVALMRDLTPAIAAAARERQKTLGRSHGSPTVSTPSESFTPKGSLQEPPRGRTRDIVAGLLGVSAAKLARAAQVVAAAEAEPERFGRLQRDMDRTGKVDGPFRRLVVMRQAAEIRAEPPPLPSRGPYRVIAADPPWPFDADREDPSDRGTHPYPQMSYEAIEAFMRNAIGAIGHRDLAVWFWTTNHHMGRAYLILAALGLEVKTVLTWGKDKIGRGQYLREQTEHCLVAVRGKPLFQLSAESTLMMAPRRAHSEKPAAFYELVERVCPAPRYACLFSHLQAPRERWDQHSTENDAEARATLREAVA
ncbi:MT-A70 family methyltransferase [Enterovirga rhinocerotis]|nr:MT-A70 family methyltransferase [Enterovirga rhinocerotis]